MSTNPMDLHSWQIDELRILARAAGMIWVSEGRRDTHDVLSDRQRKLLDRAANSYLADELADAGEPAPGPYDPDAIYAILADGQPWMDSDGRMAWTGYEMTGLADHLERQGYLIRIMPANGN